MPRSIKDWQNCNLSLNNASAAEFQPIDKGADLFQANLT